MRIKFEGVYIETSNKLFFYSNISTILDTKCVIVDIFQNNCELLRIAAQDNNCALMKLLLEYYQLLPAEAGSLVNACKADF